MLHYSAWRAALLFLTEPSHDRYFARNKKLYKRDYLDRPEPWFAVPCVKHLEATLSREARVFEWGSGSSTLWLASRVEKVISIEHDAGWARKLRERLPENVELREIASSSQDYTGAVRDAVDFDVFIIDGRRRVDCARSFLSQLEEMSGNKLLIFDDSHRERYAEAVSDLGRLCRESRIYADVSNTVIGKTTSIFIF